MYLNCGLRIPVRGRGDGGIRSWLADGYVEKVLSSSTLAREGRGGDGNTEDENGLDWTGLDWTEGRAGLQPGDLERSGRNGYSVST